MPTLFTAVHLFLVLVAAVVIFFSLGAPIMIARTLHKRSKDLEKEEVRELLGVLYYLYRKECYWYEAVNMVFKLMLWSALVFFEHGSEMQLATALVVNAIQLVAHVHFRPFGGKEAWLMNLLQLCALVLTSMINFGGLALNYLKVR